MELARVSRALAAEGATGNTVLSMGAVPAELGAALDEMVRPPSPAVGYRVVKGLLAEYDEPGPTPLRWSLADPGINAAFDIGLALTASRLGRVFGWTGQQDGRIVHNILPSPGQEHLQVGASSVVPLAWHSEDAFHPQRADFLLLACVRNPDGIGSRLSTISGAAPSEEDVDQLARPLAAVMPDASYGEAAGDRPGLVGAPTVWRGDDKGLRVRYDPSYSRWLTDDGRFHQAYGRLGQRFEDAGFVVPLDPGDLLIIDNDTSVHGRVAFRPRYDGTDRWLKRILVRSGRRRPASEQNEHGYDQVQVDPYRAPTRRGA
ncbi:TauD/TfdA family dioxygenase [Streptomyces sp. NBC_01217]|uniref:TauD/TfdA family dioxygenase n=1 Tax=Streptomyces sp. NBC_01217 TaxID=2903779 RepID=UPI002E1070E5|nr:TauD/TfdA family dioxygenase [Streptomyces sp. NBC_01217]